MTVTSSRKRNGLSIIAFITVVLLQIAGCAPIPQAPQGDGITPPRMVELPKNFRDDRPAEEKSTSMTSNRGATRIAYGDDIETNAMAQLLSRIAKHYPDALAAHQVVIRKIELVGMYRSEAPPYYLAGMLNPASAALAYGATTFLQEKSVYMNIVGDIDGAEFAGWAHETCKLCSAQGTLDATVERAIEKAIDSIQKVVPAGSSGQPTVVGDQDISLR